MEEAGDYEKTVHFKNISLVKGCVFSVCSSCKFSDIFENS